MGWSSGEYVVFDSAHAAPGLFLFCAVLAFSRGRFVRLATGQEASTLLALIAEALASAGRVSARILAARMACLKGGVAANVLVLTPLLTWLSQFATRAGARPPLCSGATSEKAAIAIVD